MRTPKPIAYRQLCALVKSILLEEPTIDDIEWKERARIRLAKWGFEQPASGTLGQAMTQVEYALRQTIGPRGPIPVPATRPAPMTELPPERRTHRPMGWGVVLDLMRRLAGSPASAPSSPAPAARDLLEVSEVDALNEFWSACRDRSTNRLALLRAFAELAIVRPASWDVDAIRAEAHEHALHADHCFVCLDGSRPREWHHVIQIQHGGSNYVRNRVALCALCHQAVHPWLHGQPSRTTSGFARAIDCAPRALPRRSA